MHIVCIFTENVDSGTPKKFHHQNAPEYLERRKRLRRKSGGNILSDILKPQRARRNHKRNESESPRTVSSEGYKANYLTVIMKHQGTANFILYYHNLSYPISL